MKFLQQKSTDAMSVVMVCVSVLMMALFLAPGCSGGEKNGSGDQGTSPTDTSQPQNTCTYDEQSFTPGESLTNSTDACIECQSTECFCQVSGEWLSSGGACEVCDASVIAECTETCEHGYQQDENGCDICACNDAPETCTEGATQDVGDGCNVCTCNADGGWDCTTEVCDPVCEDGEQKTLEDGCTECVCVDGQWKCIEQVCGECTPGEVMPPPDDCCSCNAAGEWDCTDNPCPQTCDEGDTKEKGDGCNTCTCDGNNQWVCTEETCGEGTDCPPGKAHDCEMKTFWGKNLVTGTCCEYDSPCAIPDELQKFGDNESCLNAPWDGWAGDAESSQAGDEGVPPDTATTPEGDGGAE